MISVKEMVYFMVLDDIADILFFYLIVIPEDIVWLTFFSGVSSQ